RTRRSSDSPSLTVSGRAVISTRAAGFVTTTGRSSVRGGGSRNGMVSAADGESLTRTVVRPRATATRYSDDASGPKAPGSRFGFTRRSRATELSSTDHSPGKPDDEPLHTSCVQRISDTLIGIESPTPTQIPSDPDGPPAMLRLNQLMLARYLRCALA